MLTGAQDQRGDADGAFNLAVVLEERGDRPAALAAYQRADQLGHGEAACELGVLLDQRGDLAAAEACFRRAAHRGDPRRRVQPRGAARRTRRPARSAESVRAGRRESGMLEIAEIARAAALRLRTKPRARPPPAREVITMAGRLADATAPSPERPGPPPAPAELPADSGQRLRVLIADHDGLARWTIRTALQRNRPGRDRPRRRRRPRSASARALLPPNRRDHRHRTTTRRSRRADRQNATVTPDTRVLTVSVDDHQTAIAALRAGAVGHIGKDIDPTRARAARPRAANGEAIIPQRLMTPLLEQLREIPAAGWRPLHSRLTTREWEIVDLLARRRQHPTHRRATRALTLHHLQPRQKRATKTRRALTPRRHHRRRTPTQRGNHIRHKAP